MKYQRLGSTGIKVSGIGLGTNEFGNRTDEATGIRMIHLALDAGLNLIDTSNTYPPRIWGAVPGASESIIGKAIKGRRHDVFVASKGGRPMGDGPNDFGASRAHLTRELEGTLRRLQTEFVDLYQIHRYDPDTRHEESLRALDDAVRAGKIRYIGASDDYPAWRLVQARCVSDRLGLARFETVQTSYSLADRRPERELLPMCREVGLGFLAYKPLGRGTLTGKYRVGEPPPAGSRVETQPDFVAMLRDETLKLAEGIGQVAAELGCATSQLALAWAIAQPGVSSLIVGARTSEQLEENLKAADVELEDSVLSRLTSLSEAFASQ
jgi:aryl-alcohol dehydrogenase-like predicted oxidoreductase